MSRLSKAVPRRKTRLTNQETHQKTPDSDKEDRNHDNDGPGRYLDIAPEISPVSTAVEGSDGRERFSMMMENGQYRIELTKVHSASTVE